MYQLILVSNMACLETRRLSTSSSKYERELARGMSMRVGKVSVLSFKAKEREVDGNIELIPCTTSDPLRDFSGLRDNIAKILPNADKNAILFFGYNPKLIAALVGFRDRAKIASVIYDTHKGALEGKGLIRRIVIDRFFNAGLRRVNDLDGVVLFRETAAEQMGLKKPYCVILPSADTTVIEPFKETKNGRLRFLYAGTLCGYNSTKELVDAFKEYDADDAELFVFGDGPLAGYVKEAEKVTDKIKYFGRVPTEKIDRETEKADVLVNLRDMTSDVNLFAFPSKLVDYMKSGKAVMSTAVSDASEFNDAVFLCTDTSARGITSSIGYICSHREKLREKVEKSSEYLKKYHDSQSNFGRLFDFLFCEL